MGDSIQFTGGCFFNPGPRWALNATIVKNVYKTHSNQEWYSSEFIYIDKNSSALFVFDIPYKRYYEYCGFKFVFPKIEGGCHDYYFESEWEQIRNGTNGTLYDAYAYGKGCRSDFLDRGGPFRILELDHQPDPIEEVENYNWNEMQHLNWTVIQDPEILMREPDEDVAIVERVCIPGRKVFRVDALENASFIFPKHGEDVRDPNYYWGRPPVGAYIVPCYM